MSEVVVAVFHVTEADATYTRPMGRKRTEIQRYMLLNVHSNTLRVIMVNGGEGR